MLCCPYKIKFTLLENHQIFQAFKYANIESEFPLRLIFYIYSCVDYNKVRVEMGEQAYVSKVSKIRNCPCRKGECEEMNHLYELSNSKRFENMKGNKKRHRKGCIIY